MSDSDAWTSQFHALGEFIRRQRMLANLSLREMADLASVSNAYLSQVERGLHEPSVRVLSSVAKALNLSAETLLAQVGMGADANQTGRFPVPTTEAAIMADAGLSQAQKKALLAVYRSYLAEGVPPAKPLDSARPPKPRTAPTRPTRTKPGPG